MKALTELRLAWVLAALAVLMLAGNILLASTSSTHSVGVEVINTLPTIPYLLIGLLILNRASGNRYGWVLLLVGFSFSQLVFWNLYSHLALIDQPGSLPFGWGAAFLAAIGWVGLAASLAFALLLFPTGRPLSRRWGILVWIAAFGAVSGSLIGFFQPISGTVGLANPYAPQGAAGRLIETILQAFVFMIFIGILGGAISLVLRFLQARGRERQQIKWFVFTAMIFSAWLVTDNFTELPGVWELVKENFFFMLLPVMIGVSILRYQLWDIDVLIRRTLSYAALTLTLGLVYFGSVVVLQGLFQSVSGEQSPAAVVVSTLIIAALFTPLRRRIQQDIDRRFYRRKYDAEKTLETFAARARDEVELDQLSATLVAVVSETMQPVKVSLWLFPISRNLPWKSSGPSATGGSES